jgi:hypothetical protein
VAGGPSLGAVIASAAGAGYGFVGLGVAIASVLGSNAKALMFLKPL